MPAVHRAVANDVVLCWPEFGIVVFAGFDRDTVVASVERHALDENIIARLGVETVVIGANAVGIDIADHDIAASDRVMLPERRVDHLVALQQHTGAAEEFDHRWRQLMTDAEDPLRKRDLCFGQSRKIKGVRGICIAVAARRVAVFDQIYFRG